MNEKTPLLIPPPWVAMAEAPIFIESEFSISADAVRRPLIKAVVHDDDVFSPYHRVSISSDYVNGLRSLPRGLVRARGYGPERVFVRDWDAVTHSEDYSYILNPDGRQVPVELYWPSVEIWVSLFEAKQRDAASRARREAAASPRLLAPEANEKSNPLQSITAHAWMLDYARKYKQKTGSSVNATKR